MQPTTHCLTKKQFIPLRSVWQPTRYAPPRTSESSHPLGESSRRIRNISWQSASEFLLKTKIPPKNGPRSRKASGEEKQDYILHLLPKHLPGLGIVLQTSAPLLYGEDSHGLSLHRSALWAAGAKWTGWGLLDTKKSVPSFSCVALNSENLGRSITISSPLLTAHTRNTDWPGYRTESRIKPKCSGF